MHILKSLSRPALCRTALLLLFLCCLVPASAQETGTAGDSVPLTRENLIATWGTKAGNMTIGLRLAEDTTASFVVSVTEEEQLQGTIRIAIDGTWGLSEDKIVFNFDVDKTQIKYSGGQTETGATLSDMIKDILLQNLGQKTNEDGTLTTSLFVCGLTKDELTIGIDSYDKPMTLKRAVQR